VPLVVLVLDNGTTALTGGQPHPGSPRDERGNPRQAVDLAGLIAGVGVAPQICSPKQPAALAAAIDAALEDDGLQVIVLRGSCPPARA